MIASCNDKSRHYDYRDVVEFGVRQAANVHSVQLL
jgi:hypothetical protein